MEDLGVNLDELTDFTNYQLDKKVICGLAILMINTIENMHHHNIIHNDIKPSNFCLGYASKFNIIYLIDFGFS